jgi:hypothetical protein
MTPETPAILPFEGSTGTVAERWASGDLLRP